MPTEKKAQSIDRLEKEISKANIGILTDYRGLKTPEINGLRKKLQDVNGKKFVHDWKVETLQSCSAWNRSRTDQRKRPSMAQGS